MTQRSKTYYKIIGRPTEPACLGCIGELLEARGYRREDWFYSINRILGKSRCVCKLLDEDKIKISQKEALLSIL